MTQKKNNSKLIVLIVSIIIVAIIVIVGASICFINILSSISKSSTEDMDYIEIRCWEDFYNLGEKDVGKKLLVPAIVNSITREAYYEEDDCYHTSLELQLYDKEAGSHYIIATYNRPYHAEKLQKGDAITFYGTFINKAVKIEINRIENIIKYKGL